MTRLRFILKDYDLVDEKILDEIDVVQGYQLFCGQWQIIIKKDLDEIYKTICKIENFNF